MRAVGAATLAGALTAYAMPPGEPRLAWIALVPFLYALRFASHRATLGAAIVYASILGTASIGAWLVPAAIAYFGAPTETTALLVLPALALLCAAHGALLGLVLLRRPRGAGPGVVLWYAATWACWEGLRSIAFPYYPAAVLGISQHMWLPALQIASVTGVEGVTFVIVALAAGLAGVLPPFDRRGPRAGLGCLTGMALAAAILIWGHLRLAAEPALPPASAPIILGIDVRARRAEESTLDRLLEASRAAGVEGRDLLIWPESALATDLQVDRVTWTRLSRFVASVNVPLLVGGPGTARRAGRWAHFNSMHLLRPGHGLESYHKRHPVEFAERWPAILGPPPAGITSIDVGEDVHVFRGAPAAFGVLICFEIMDPTGANELVRRGARFIVNPTNDAWFAATRVAPHLPWAPVRAIETGLPVIRVANAGASRAFDALGRPWGSTASAGGPVALSVTLPPIRETPYARFGDVFLGACLAGVVGGVLGSRRRRRDPASAPVY